MPKYKRSGSMSPSVTPKKPHRANHRRLFSPRVVDSPCSNVYLMNTPSRLSKKQLRRLRRSVPPQFKMAMPTSARKRPRSPSPPPVNLNPLQKSSFYGSMASPSCLTKNSRTILAELNKPMADDSSSSDDDQTSANGDENMPLTRSAPPLAKKCRVERPRAVISRQSSGKTRKSNSGVSARKSGLHKGRGVSHAIKKPKPNKPANKSKEKETLTIEKIKPVKTPAKMRFKQQMQKSVKTGTLSPSVNYTVVNGQIQFTRRQKSPRKKPPGNTLESSTPTTPASRGCAGSSQRKQKLFTPSRNYLELSPKSLPHSPRKKCSTLPSPIKFDKDTVEDDLILEDNSQMVNNIIESLEEQEPTKKKAGTEDNYAVYVDDDEIDKIAWNTVQELSTLENYSPEPVSLLYEESSRSSPLKLVLSSPRKSPCKRDTHISEPSSGGTRLATIVHEASATPATSPRRSPRKHQPSLGMPVARSPSKSGWSKSPQKSIVFPIFGRNANTGLEAKQDSLTKDKSSAAKKNTTHTIGRTKDGLIQMVIDAGQKSIGSWPCETCGFPYARGDATEEKIHSQQHKKYLGIVSFSGWKNERVTDNDLASNSRIVIVKPGDPKRHWEKAGAVLSVVDEALGVPYHGADPTRSEMYLFIVEKRVVGCLLAEQLKNNSYRVAKSYICRKSKARVLTADLSDSELPISKNKLVAVSRIWVHEDFRRTGVATRLMNALLVFFRFPAPPALKTELVFSHTTDAGAAFVEKYLKSSNYLVYKTD